MGISSARARLWPAWTSPRRRSGAATDAAAPGPALEAEAPSAPTHHPAAALRVLVVDDDPVNLHVTSAMLSCWGIKPMLAADGAQAVTLADEQPLDLILMDLQMPVLDGLGATRQIRRAEQALCRTRVPVVAYTSMATTPALLGDFGIDAVLTKPCDAPALRACLLRWCTPQGQRHGEPAMQTASSPA